LFLRDDDVVHITCMAKAVKAMSITITNSSHPDVHPCHYVAFMDVGGFRPEAMMVALSHLFDNMAQDYGFVHIEEDQTST
jgi:hypothetical protein